MARIGLVVAVLTASTLSAAPFDPSDADPSGWFRLEYVNLWTSHASLSAPLVTTGDATSLGRLGFPQTRTLLGPGNLPAPVFPAMRLTAGGWLNDDVFGGEISFFETVLRASHFTAASDATGSPFLAVPFADVTSGAVRESSLVVSQPGVATGRVWSDDAATFFGLDLDGLASLREHLDDDRATLSLVAGLRTLGFRERFKFSSGTEVLGVSISHNDAFLAKDSFLGPEFGLRGGYRLRRFSIEGTGKVAVGGSLARLYESPQNNLLFAYPRILPVPGGGWFTQPTNTGYRYGRAFSVVPAAQLRVGYDLTSRLRLTLGYEAFLWTRMVRAPSQIDRAVNLSQVLGPLVGSARPAPAANFTDFWAQGFTAGVQLNY